MRARMFPSPDGLIRPTVRKALNGETDRPNPGPNPKSSMRCVLSADIPDGFDSPHPTSACLKVGESFIRARQDRTVPRSRA